MKILVIDIGGTHVKFLVSGQTEHREFPSGPHLTPRAMVARVKRATADWKYDAVSIGYPGPVLRNHPVAEPHNLGRGWVGFNFPAAFRRPLKLVNDAAMQALGSYRGGKMLFLGLGTGLGTCFIVDGILEPMELAHLPYKKATYEDYVGLGGLRKRGKKRWRRHVADVVRRLTAAVEPSDVVLGGGNVKKLKKLPPGCRAVDNRKAFVGGFRLWEPSRPAAKPVPRKRARPTAKPPRRKYSKLRPATKPNRPRSPVAVGRSVPTPPPIARSGAVGTPRLTSPTQATSKARHPAKTGPTPPVAEGPATAGSVPKYAEVTKHFAPSVLRTPRRARQLKVEPPAPNPPSPGIESAPAQKNPNEPTPT